MLARVGRYPQLGLSRSVDRPVQLPLAVSIGIGRQCRLNEPDKIKAAGSVLEAHCARVQIRQATLSARRATMNGNLSLAELDDRIAILRDNLRQLVAQAAAASGSQNEERIADRITQQTEELDKLILERDSRAKK